MLVLISDKIKIKLSFVSGVIFWTLFTSSIIYSLFIQNYNLSVSFSSLFPKVCLTGFILSVFSYYRFIITKVDTFNFIDLLWKVFITGLVTTLISLALRFFLSVFANSTLVENPITINFFYCILIGLVMIYMISTFMVWKKLILYQKSKKLLRLWQFFELVLLASYFFDFLEVKLGEPRFNFILVLLAISSIMLIFNLKWIAYLNFKQKWKSMLFILLSAIYLYGFSKNLLQFSNTDSLIIDLFDRSFIWGMYGFLLFYAIISILVILFNLPTSSVFEKTLKEALDFQKLSQSIPRGETKNQTYEFLLDSSMSAVFATAAWLEIKEDTKISKVIRNLKEKDILKIKSTLNGSIIKSILDLELTYKINSGKFIHKLKHPQYKSIVALPILIQGNQVGFIALLSEVSNAFNPEMINIITTFVNQASISLENLSLVQESIENERYKEQLKIAKNVQKSLLPTKLINNDYLTMAAFSMAADEVGGDYYDILEYQKNKFGLIIADVSGKGTSAAFQMALMKGIFHSLGTQGVTPKDFNKKANTALSQCLELQVFITATYFDIDSEKNILHFSRAGHCPSLYYCKKENTVNYLNADGMGLGMLRNISYHNYVHSKTLKYEEEDALLLYTDGITEARNRKGEQFGSERLKKSFASHAFKLAEGIKEGIKTDLSTFIEEVVIDDDYTLVIIQFKKTTKKWLK